MKFRFFPFAWWMPSTVSTWKNLVLAARLTLVISPVFPDTAARGEALEAFLAGALAASSTVTRPITAPAAIPGRLTPKTGISPKNLSLTYRSSAHRAQVTRTPASTPRGMAVTHQPRASRRTNRTICLFWAPRHRSMPKNPVLLAMLLLRLPDIISTPARTTRSASSAAVP